MTVLFRIDRVRGTAYEGALRDVLRAVPDFRILWDGASSDPLRDFDSIFAASANPRYLQQTFLAVRHTLGRDGVKRALDARWPEPAPWTNYAGLPIRALTPTQSVYQDPRRVLLAADDLAVVARPEWLKSLARDAGPDAAIRPEGATGSFSMLDGLRQIERAAPDDTLVQYSVQGLRFFVPGAGRLPSFEALRMRVSDASAPRVTVDIQFATPQSAADFARGCPALQRRLVDAIPMARLLGVAKYIERFRCAADAEYVTATAIYTAREIAEAAQLARPFIPRPPALPRSSDSSDARARTSQGRDRPRHRAPLPRRRARGVRPPTRRWRARPIERAAGRGTRRAPRAAGRRERRRGTAQRNAAARRDQTELVAQEDPRLRGAPPLLT